MKLAFLVVFLFVKAAAAVPKHCNFCLDHGQSSCGLLHQVTVLPCDTAPNALGTTHCATAVGRYLNDVRGGIYSFTVKGCIDCQNKLDACFALGGWLKVHKKWTLLKCKIECCTNDNCNTQSPHLSKDAITVFTPNVHGPEHCHGCQGDDSTQCDRVLKDQGCATDSLSLGTTHCGTAVVRYSNPHGEEANLFLRGCVNCRDKQAACAAIGGLIKNEAKKMLQCKIECCTWNNCNTQTKVPTLSSGKASAHGQLPLFKGALIFAVASGNIMYHFCV